MNESAGDAQKQVDSELPFRREEIRVMPDEAEADLQVSSFLLNSASSYRANEAAKTADDAERIRAKRLQMAGENGQDSSAENDCVESGIAVVVNEPVVPKRPASNSEALILRKQAKFTTTI